MSSVFTSRVTESVPVGEASVVIRKLAPKHLDKARKAQQLKSIDEMKDFGGPAFIKEVQALSADAKKPAAVDDPLASYDRQTLLESAIQSWTLDEPLTPAAIEDLDDETQAALATAVLRLAKPALFAAAEDVQKNG